MRFSRAQIILLVILILVFSAALWLFIPLRQTARKDILYGRAFVAGVVRVRPLLDRPFSSMVSALTGNHAAMDNIPFIIRPLVPPVMEFYLQGGNGGAEWAIVADLGWRSRLFRMLHGVIMGQMQYRGMGAIEGEHILRTPAGDRILFYQDGRTLFIAEGENVIAKITGPDSVAGTGTERADIQKPAADAGDRKTIASVSFTNIDGDITRGAGMLEDKAGFILLPSSGSLMRGSVDIRKTGGAALVCTIALTAREDGDAAGLEGDVTYILALLDRFLSAQNMKTDSSLAREENRITVNIMIHSDGESQ